MTEPVPDGPTDPQMSAVEDSTTVVTPPGFGPPTSPASPPGPPLGPPPGQPPLPPTELATERFGGGRVYSSTGETQVGSGPPTPPPPPPGGAGRGKERGKTTIADEVVERVIDKVVNLTVEEAAGVHGLHIASDSEQPVKVTLDGDQATIEFTVDIDFGHAVLEVVENVRENVISQSERLLGLTVTEVNVLVADVNFEVPDDE